MTTQEKINHLVELAKQKMRHSPDPYHDIDHAQSVAENAARIASTYTMTDKERQALILAAWWHDVGRTTIRKPSFIMMIFLDDLISALMLWRETIRFGLFGSVAGMSTRIIFCHSFGTGKLLTRLLLRRRTQLLLDILVDADKLDMLNTKRLNKILELVKLSRCYHRGYIFLSWYNFTSNELRLTTEEARRYFEKVLTEFIEWMTSPEIVQYHIQEFGIVWVEKTAARIEFFLYSMGRPELVRFIVH